VTEIDQRVPTVPGTRANGWVWDGSQWMPDVVAAVDAASLVVEGTPADQGRGDRPMRPRALFQVDYSEFLVAGVSGAALALVVRLVLDWQHPLTLAIWFFIGFLVVEWLLVRDRAGSMVASDRVVTCLVWATGAMAVGVLAWMIVFVVAKGIGALDWDFFTDDMSDVGPLNPGGGALHAVIGTLQQTAIATLLAVPIGIMTAVYLNELKGRMAPVVRFFSDAMSGLPSIVAGLLIYTLWVTSNGGLDQGFSGFAAALALAVVMLPIVTRTAEEVLRTVDPALREASRALGSPQWRTVARVVLPTARSGLVTAAILSIARIVGETAPLLLTAFGTASVNTNPMAGEQSALPLFVFQLIRQPNEVQNQRAWTGALVLILVVVVLFVIARVISARGDRLVKGRR
jgi:phosphate transport system permease protein